jgi:cytoskeletal protein CcmA (bactofilin family)
MFWTKKIWLISRLIVSILVFLPVTTFGYTSLRWETINVTVPINDDYYVFGNHITIDSTIMGDLFVIGNYLSVGWSIKQDCTIIAREVILRSTINDDCKIFANTIRIFGNINGDLLAFANNIDIANDVIIKGDLIATVSNIIINGDVQGKISLNAEKFRFNSSIKGNSFFNVKNIIFGERSEIIGSTKIVPYETLWSDTLSIMKEKTNGTFTIDEERSYSNIIDILSFAYHGYLVYMFWFLSIFWILIFFPLETPLKYVAQILDRQPGKSFLVGIWFYCVIPFAILITALSIIGIPIWFFLWGIYLSSILWFELPAVVISTAYVSHKFFPQSNRQSTLGKITTLITFSWLGALLIGIDIIVACFAIGAIILSLFTNHQIPKKQNK